MTNNEKKIRNTKKSQIKKEIEKIIIDTDIPFTPFKKSEAGKYVSKMSLVELKDYKEQLIQETNNAKINKEKMKTLLDGITDTDRKVLKIKKDDGEKIYYYLNAKNIKMLKNVIETKTVKKISYDSGIASDAIVAQLCLGFKVYEIELEDVKVGRFVSGSFFKYYCLIGMDFSRYGILKDFDADYYKENCFIHALRCCKIDEVKINSIKESIKDGHLSLCKLNTVCDKMEINIVLHRETKESNNNTKTTYGTKTYEKIVDIAYYDEHYFIYETTNITSYAINNYEKIKDKQDFNKIYKFREGKGYNKDEKRFINSLSLFVSLLENKDKVLKKIVIDENMLSTNYYNLVEDEIVNLEYNDKDVQIYKPYDNSDKVKKDKEGNETIYNNYEDGINKMIPIEFKKNNKIVFFDFESITTDNKKRNKDDDKFVHIPYMVSYSLLDDDDKVEPVNKVCLDIENNCLGKVFLSDLVFNNKKSCDHKNFILYAHNMRYDLSFISKYLNNIDTTTAGNKIIQLTGYYYGRKIIVKDTYTLISSKLSEFPDMFGFEGVKELINYNMYNEKIFNMNNDVRKYKKCEVSYDELITSYYANNNEQFKKNVNEWKLLNNKKVDIIKYAKIYCNMDVKILKKGFIKFSEWMIELFNIDIYQSLSISGVADKVLKIKGCYEGVYALSSIPRRFIAQSVVGGRTMIANNEKVKYMDKINFKRTFESKNEEYKYLIKKLKNNVISDYDGVSLYPSSMNRIKGFMKGKPMPFYNQMTYEQLQSKDYYYVEIIIKDVGIKRSFSLMSMKNDEGVRIFDNTYIDKKMVVDKTMLEDLIEFQKVKFEIVKGYYFNEGFNDKINNVMGEIFIERKKLKDKENKMEMVYKLLMNSAYGKTILKEQDSKTKYFNNEEDATKYGINHYNNVIESHKLYNDDKWLIKERVEINSHFNYCHIGSYILSMSKRIMNEVICLAEDLNIKIMYQDTDSMHLFKNDLELLKSEYKKKYNRELDGKKLGQFHTDFELKKRHDDNSEFSKSEHKMNKFKCVDSVGAIFLGKKCYIDVLKGDGGNFVGVHSRMKGISEASLIHTSNKRYPEHITEEMRLIHLYQDLYDGEEIEFDLLCDGEKVKFETSDLIVQSVIEFERKLKF